jgi:scavenger receptor class B, member 1
VPLLLAIQRVKDSPTDELKLKTAMLVSSPEEFHTRTVEEYLFGYTDPFVNTIALGIPNFTKEKVGIIGTRRGISTDNLTVFTGEDTLDNLGRVYAMNDEVNMTYWSTSECNQIRGTDGTQFSPSSLDQEQKLEIFIKAICRPYPLQYDREVTVLNGLPAWRYRPLPNVFGSSKINPENACYCDADVENCLPSGVFDAEKCIGVSVLMSYPHFYEGDEILLSPYEGLNPNKHDHETYADIHPRMAFPIGGFSRLQINLRVRKIKPNIFGKTYFDKLPKDIIIPLLWFEITVDNIPPDFLALIYNTTHSANATYFTLQYTSLICMVVSVVLLVSTTLIYRKRLSAPTQEKKIKEDVIMQPQSKSEPLYPTLPVQS